MSLPTNDRVLIISTMGGHPWGGSEYLWKQVADHLLEGRQHVEASVYGWGRQTSRHIKDLSKRGVKIRTRGKIYAPQLLYKPSALLRRKFCAVRQLQRHVHQARPDVVLISCGSLSELLLPGLPEAFDHLTGGRRPGKYTGPYEVVFQTNIEQQAFPEEQLERIRTFLNGARRVHFVSNRLIQQAQRQLVWQGNNACLVHNPVNLDLDLAKDMPWPKTAATDVVHWACVGRLESSIKGQLVLLQVLATEKWAERNWTLDFFGEGPDRRLIQAVIDGYKLNDRVTICGFSDDVAGIWKDHHGLILPSYYEGQPLALQEAMACGRVGIGTDVGGMADLLNESSGTGFLASAPLPDALDEAMDRAWLVRGNWAEIGHRAQQHLEAFRGADPVGDFTASLLSVQAPKS